MTREPDRFGLAPDALERIARAFGANPTAQHSGAAVASILRYLVHHTPAPAAAPAASQPSEPVAPAPPVDPCQRCGKLGGHVVVFRFDRTSTAKWMCPHCLDAQEKRLAEVEELISDLRDYAEDRRKYGNAKRVLGAQNSDAYLEQWALGTIHECDAVLERIAARTSPGGAGEGT